MFRYTVTQVYYVYVLYFYLYFSNSICEDESWDYTLKDEEDSLGNKIFKLHHLHSRVPGDFLNRYLHSVNIVDLLVRFGQNYIRPNRHLLQQSI